MFIIADGDDDDGGFAPLADAAGDFYAVHIGQAEIEQDEIGVLGGGELDGLAAVLGFDDGVGSTERREQKLADGSFVIGDEDLGFDFGHREIITVE